MVDGNHQALDGGRWWCLWPLTLERIRAVAIGLIIGGAIWGVWDYLRAEIYRERISPLHAIAAHVLIQPSGERVLRVTYTGLPAPGCIHIGQHLLVRPSSDGKPDEWLVAPTGGRLRPTEGGEFRVFYPLSAALPAGTWDYIYRGSDNCQGFLGLATPVPFNVDLKGVVIPEAPLADGGR